MKYIKIIGISIFIYIIVTLDFTLIYKSLISLNYGNLVIYTGLFYIFFILKVYRWHIIQNYFSKKLTFRENYLVWMETIYLSFITPAKIGDIARVWVLNKYFGIEKKESFYAYFFDRFQDVIFLLLGVFIGIYFLPIITFNNWYYSVLLVLFLGYLFKDFLISIIQIKVKYLYYKPTSLVFELKVFIINFFTYFFYFLQTYFLAKALNLNISYEFIIGLVSISTLATILPISIAGLGVREGVFIALLATIDIGKEDAVLLSLLGNVFFVAIFIIILHLFTKFFMVKRLQV